MRAILVFWLSFLSLASAGMQTPFAGEESDVSEEELLYLSDAEYNWLYEILMPEALRTAKPDESYKSFRVHLRDSYDVFPKPDDMKTIRLNKSTFIEGRITYVGVFPKSYRYTVTAGRDGEVIIGVKIHLRGLLAGEKDIFTSKIADAQEIWNHGRPSADFKYSFSFELVDSEDEAQFSPQVLDSTRGPYDQYWSRKWTGRSIAHEIGHMMGLGDEYKTLSGKIDCLETSLMCSSWAGDLMYHHYYFILRRLITPNPT